MSWTVDEAPGWRAPARGCALALSIAALGCGDDAVGTGSDATGDDATSQPSATDTGATDASTSGASEGSSGGEDSDTDTDGEPDAEPGPLQPYVEPEPIPVAEWRITTLNHAIGSDPVRAAIYDGALTLPPVGEAFGVTWSAAAPGEGGALPSSASSGIYAVTEIDAPAGRYVLARASRIQSVFANNLYEQPGGLRGPQWTPVGVTPDAQNLIAARGSGSTSIELFSTPDELVLDTELALLPDYPVGDDATQWVGVPVLNLTHAPALQLRARVIEDDHFLGTEVVHPGVAPVSRTQLAFRLEPRAAFEVPGQRLAARLRVEVPGFAGSYEREVELVVVDPQDGRAYDRTRRARSDGSVQFDAILPPADFDPDVAYGLLLSLHGAGVWATGQANSYSAKDWAYIVSPTNRDPYGFDWEEFGRVDAIEALDAAMDALPIDPRRVHLTGHSMGGHGSWHVGVHFSDRFATVAPSAGWIALGSPQGALGAARAAQRTLDFETNLAQKLVYIIHGKADDNVPASEGSSMFNALQDVVAALYLHLEPKVGHWWDVNHAEPGVDCVDWEPMIALAKERELEATPLDFQWVAAGPAVNPEHSYIRLHARDTPLMHAAFTSARDGATVTLTTSNARSFELDLDRLAGEGVDTIVVDGQDIDVSAGGVHAVGPTEGKRAGVSGPLNQVFHRPYCYVHADDGPAAFPQLAAFLSSWWVVQARGQACVIPMSALDDDIRASYNLIYVGVPLADIGEVPEAMGVRYDGGPIEFGGQTFADSCMAFVFPSAATGRLSAAWIADPGGEEVCFRYMPFTSGWGLPGYSNDSWRYGGPMADYAIWRAGGALATGFFDADWALDPALVTAY